MNAQKRRPFIAGNWKMHKSGPEAVQLSLALKKALGAGRQDRDVMVAPPFTALALVADKLKGTGIIVAGQTLHPSPEGAFTGAISAPMLKAAGASAVIVGHSERRKIFGETDEDVNARVRTALSNGLTPILCLGETLEERESEETFKVLERQLTIGLKRVSNESASSLILAYEPVWAIGTGKTASPAQAQEVHQFLREKLGGMFRSYVPGNVRILYGGSVKPGNVDELMSQPDIDGALVGGASLNAEDFARIVNFQ